MTTFATLPGDLLTAIASYVDGPHGFLSRLLALGIGSLSSAFSLLMGLFASYAAGRLFERCRWRRSMLYIPCCS